MPIRIVSGNIKGLVCQVILQEHVIKGYVFMGESCSWASQNPAKFSGHRHYGNGDLVVSLLCDLTRCDQRFK